jgi:hypothetical protein
LIRKKSGYTDGAFSNGLPILSSLLQKFGVLLSVPILQMTASPIESEAGINTLSNLMVQVRVIRGQWDPEG